MTPKMTAVRASRITLRGFLNRWPRQAPQVHSKSGQVIDYMLSGIWYRKLALSGICPKRGRGRSCSFATALREADSAGYSPEECRNYFTAAGYVAV